MRAIILPESWYEEATVFIERLNSLQPLYFIVPLSIDLGHDPTGYLPYVNKWMVKNLGTSAMVVLPKSFASGDKIDQWPSVLQSDGGQNWVSSLFFADSWGELECTLQGFLKDEDRQDDGGETHLTCQYQPPYTAMLGQWEGGGRKSYHPGDYFKEDILPAISKMKGNWLYWGHGEGDRLRGYGHLHTADLLAHKNPVPLNTTLWFTCSTLDRDYPENIALSWYLSGATKCLLASPHKVSTEENQGMSQTWFELAKNSNGKTIASLILEIQGKDRGEFKKTLDQYFLLGIPWVSASL